MVAAVEFHEALEGPHGLGIQGRQGVGEPGQAPRRPSWLSPGRAAATSRRGVGPSAGPARAAGWMEDGEGRYGCAAPDQAPVPAMMAAATTAFKGCRRAWLAASTVTGGQASRSPQICEVSKTNSSPTQPCGMLLASHTGPRAPRLPRPGFARGTQLGPRSRARIPVMIQPSTAFVYRQIHGSKKRG